METIPTAHHRQNTKAATPAHLLARRQLDCMEAMYPARSPLPYRLEVTTPADKLAQELQLQRDLTSAAQGCINEQANRSLRYALLLCHDPASRESGAAILAAVLAGWGIVVPARSG